MNATEQKVVTDYMSVTKTSDVDLNEAIVYGYRKGVVAGKGNVIFTIKRVSMLTIMAILLILSIWSLSSSCGHPKLVGETVNELIECYEKRHDTHIWVYRRNLIKKACKDADPSQWPDIVERLCRESGN